MQFLLLDIPKCLIRNNGLMGIGIKIPLHKAIVFDLGTTSADGFLEQHPACILFVRQQFIESLSIPLGLTCGREDALFLQPSGNLAETVTVEVAVKDPADDGSLIRINHQLTIRSNVIAIAFALGHLRRAVLETSVQARIRYNKLRKLNMGKKTRFAVSGRMELGNHIQKGESKPCQRRLYS